MHDSEITVADPKLRKTTCYFVIALIILLAALSYFLEGYLDSETIEAEELISRLYTAVYTLCLSLSLTAYPLWRIFLLGRRTRLEQRFPPQGAKVIRDTLVLQGRSAILRGYFLQFFASLMAAVFVAVPVTILVLVKVITSGP